MHGRFKHNAIIIRAEGLVLTGISSSIRKRANPRGGVFPIVGVSHALFKNQLGLSQE